LRPLRMTITQINQAMIKKFVFALVALLPLTGALAQDIKIGYYNRAEIFQSMPETVEGTKKLDKIGMEHEAELVRMNEEYQKKGSEYIAGRDTLPEAIRLRRETELQDLQQRIQSFYQDAQDKMKEQQQLIIAPINTKLDGVVKSVGTENGFWLIFDISLKADLSFYSVEKCVDVTNLIRAKLGLK